MKLSDDASAVVSKRSSMTLFSDSTNHYSHRVRIVLAEKGVTVDLIESDSGIAPAELADVNPYNTMPTLVDRDLVLYESKVMMEYLDERFPHPPLLPVYPVARAESRLLMYRIERDWCSLVDAIQNSRSDNVVTKSAKSSRSSTVALHLFCGVYRLWALIFGPVNSRSRFWLIWTVYSEENPFKKASPSMSEKCVSSRVASL